MVSHAAAASLDVQELASEDPISSLAAQLEDRRLLLVLDNWSTSSRSPRP